MSEGDNSEMGSTNGQVEANRLPKTLAEPVRVIEPEKLPEIPSFLPDGGFQNHHIKEFLHSNPNLVTSPEFIVNTLSSRGNFELFAGENPVFNATRVLFIAPKEGSLQSETAHNDYFRKLLDKGDDSFFKPAQGLPDGRLKLGSVRVTEKASGGRVEETRVYLLPDASTQQEMVRQATYARAGNRQAQEKVYQLLEGVRIGRPVEQEVESDIKEEPVSIFEKQSRYPEVSQPDLIAAQQDSLKD